MEDMIFDITDVQNDMYALQNYTADMFKNTALFKAQMPKTQEDDIRMRTQYVSYMRQRLAKSWELLVRLKTSNVFITDDNEKTA